MHQTIVGSNLKNDEQISKNPNRLQYNFFLPTHLSSIQSNVPFIQSNHLYRGRSQNRKSNWFSKSRLELKRPLHRKKSWVFFFLMFRNISETALRCNLSQVLSWQILSLVNFFLLFFFFLPSLIGAKTTLARRQNHFARRQARFGKFSNDFGRRPNGL